MTNFPVTCGFNHATIGFSGGECPVCKAEDLLEDAIKKNKYLEEALEEALSHVEFSPGQIQRVRMMARGERP